MLLFEEMEKTFPELEKVYVECLAVSAECLNVDSQIAAVENITVAYAIDTFLKEDSLLYSLFLQAGFHSKSHMAARLVEWMLVNRAFAQNRH